MQSVSNSLQEYIDCTQMFWCSEGFKLGNLVAEGHDEPGG